GQRENAVDRGDNGVDQALNDRRREDDGGRRRAVGADVAVSSRPGRTVVEGDRLALVDLVALDRGERDLLCTDDGTGAVRGQPGAFLRHTVDRDHAGNRRATRGGRPGVLAERGD